MLEFYKNTKSLSLPHQIQTKMSPVSGKTSKAEPTNHPISDSKVLRTYNPALKPTALGKPATVSPGAEPAIDECFFLAVCGEEEVPDYHEAGITEMLTCVSPERPVMRPNWPSLRIHLIVRCDDVEEPLEGYVSPTEEHVRQIIQFGRDALQRSQRGNRVRLLVHCAAGISRSTAAALLILSMKLGKGAEADAMRELTSIRPICRPNALIVGHGDRLLVREGRLVHQLNLWKSRPHPAIVPP